MVEEPIHNLSSFCRHHSWGNNRISMLTTQSVRLYLCAESGRGVDSRDRKHDSWRKQQKARAHNATPACLLLCAAHGRGLGLMNYASVQYFSISMLFKEIAIRIHSKKRSNISLYPRPLFSQLVSSWWTRKNIFDPETLYLNNNV